MKCHVSNSFFVNFISFKICFTIVKMLLNIYVVKNYLVHLYSDYISSSTFIFLFVRPGPNLRGHNLTQAVLVISKT